MTSQPVMDVSGAERISVAGVFRDVGGKPWNVDRSAVRLMNRLVREEALLRVRVPIGILVATQDDVSADYAASSLRHIGRIDGEPFVVKYEGAFYVTDGHHRVMTRHAEGETEIVVRLCDLDMDTQLDFPLVDLMENDQPKGRSFP